MSSSKIILTADDYGAMPFIDVAIEEAVAKGKINSVATFVTYGKYNEDKIEHIKQLIKDAPGKVGVGLHFSLTAGQPLSNGLGPIVETDEHGVKRFSEAQRFPFDHLSKDEVARELELQIEKMADHLGGAEKIDSISNHHGVAYMDHELFDVLSSVAARYEIPIRSPLSWMQSGLKWERINLPSDAVIWEGFRLGFWRNVGEMTRKDMYARVDLAKQRNLHFPFCTADVIYGKPTESRMLTLLEQYEGNRMTTEFMFHLGDPSEHAPPAVHGINPAYFTKRKHEYDLLMKFPLDTQLMVREIQKAVFRDMSSTDRELDS